MKLVREHINEKFTDNDSDPIHDLGIGLKKLIDKWFEKYDIHINYTIDKDGCINTEDSVNFNPNCNSSIIIPIKEFPEYINFNIVKGNFNLTYCGMKSLRGCPRIVKGSFYVGHNELKTLENGPQETFGYYCHYNKLISLKGAAKIIKDIFEISENVNLKFEKEYLPDYIGKDFRYSINMPQFKNKNLKKYSFNIKGHTPI